MKETYLRSSDIVFINKRLTTNRFNRPIMMWFSVTSTGHSQLIAFTMYEKEELSFFQRVAKCFLRSMHNVVPQTIIIERQLKLSQALKDMMPTSQVLFCYFHILRTLKSQYAFLEKERPDEFKILTDLPIIDRTSEFDKQLQKAESFKYTNEYHKLIIEKMSMERSKMTKCHQLQYFTGGISVC